MTKIVVDKNHFIVEASGHANYAEKGKDIVCSAITTLICALADILQLSEIENALDIDELKGYFKIKAYPTISQCHDAKIMYKTITYALKNLSDSYPGNIEYKEVNEYGR